MNSSEDETGLLDSGKSPGTPSVRSPRPAQSPHPVRRSRVTLSLPRPDSAASRTRNSLIGSSSRGTISGGFAHSACVLSTAAGACASRSERLEQDRIFTSVRENGGNPHGRGNPLAMQGLSSSLHRRCERCWLSFFSAARRDIAARGSYRREGGGGGGGGGGEHRGVWIYTTEFGFYEPDGRGGSVCRGVSI